MMGDVFKSNYAKNVRLYAELGTLNGWKEVMWETYRN